MCYHFVSYVGIRVLIYIDHAVPKTSTIEKLLKNSKYDVIKPTFNNKSGHPIVLSHAFSKTLMQKSSSSQLNIEIQKLNLDQILWVEVNDINIHENLNTKDNWQIYKRSLKNC